MKISIIAPICNEEETIPRLYAAVKKVIDKLPYESEVILVNDGSTDNSLEALKKIAREDNRFKIINFRRNFGQTAATAAGFDAASGDLIIRMDADLQNDPEDIPMMIKEIENGYDIIKGWRKNRKDKTITRKIPSIIANWLINKVTGVKIHDNGCALEVYRKEVAKEINLYGDLHRFIAILGYWRGANIKEVIVRHHPRRLGKTKYGLSRTLKVLLDLITIKFLLSYSTRPIQLFGKWGLFFFGIGFIIFIYLVFGWLFLGHSLAARPLLIIDIFIMLTGIQLIILGLIGEMITRTYYESQKRTIYSIREKINF